jgi:hypothetical protein
MPDDLTLAKEREGQAVRRLKPLKIGKSARDRTTLNGIIARCRIHGMEEPLIGVCERILVDSASRDEPTRIE